MLSIFPDYTQNIQKQEMLLFYFEEEEEETWTVDYKKMTFKLNSATNQTGKGRGGRIVIKTSNVNQGPRFFQPRLF